MPLTPFDRGLAVAIDCRRLSRSRWYLEGVPPPHVTLNQIFLGMLPFMGLLALTIIPLYTFLAISVWLPAVLHTLKDMFSSGSRSRTTIS